MKQLLLTIFFLGIYCVAFAQPTIPTDPQGVPVDGGLSILLGAGIGYGVKKLNDNRKKR
jgi:hypothetical protein